MLSFRQFIDKHYIKNVEHFAFSLHEFLIEATIEDFGHVKDFDPNTLDHNILVDAWNMGNFPKRQIKTIKSVEQFKTAVAPYETKAWANYHEKQRFKTYHEQAVREGRINLIHDDPESGMKIYQIKTSNKGKGTSCVSIADGALWCTSNASKTDIKYNETMQKKYDPLGENTFVLHFDKEPVKKLTRISINGVRAKQYLTGRAEDKVFQDKSNNLVEKEDWAYLVKKYKLDELQHILGGIRGIPLNIDKIVNDPRSLTPRLVDAALHGTEEQRNKALAHPNMNGIGLFDLKQRQELVDNFSSKILRNRIKFTDIIDASNKGILTDAHKDLLNSWLSAQILKGKHSSTDIDIAHDYGYLTDEHKKLLQDDLVKSLKSKILNGVTSKVNNAHEYGYLNDEHKNLIENRLNAQINDLSSVNLHDILNMAHKTGILKDEHKHLLAARLEKKLNGDINDLDDENTAAKEYGYYGLLSPDAQKKLN